MIFLFIVFFYFYLKDWSPTTFSQLKSVKPQLQKHPAENYFKRMFVKTIFMA